MILLSRVTAEGYEIKGQNNAFSLSLLLPLSFNQHVALQNKIKNAGFVTRLCVMLSIF